MEEVDSIILHFLRQLNVNIEDNKKSMCDLSVETIYEAASLCLRTIDPSLKIPHKLPPGISHRIEVAAHLAACCKDLGYKNDVGYQTFLYYNEAELRQVFMFLIENLPNEGKKTTPVVKTKQKSLLMQEICNKINEDMKTIWIPPCCSPRQQTIGDHDMQVNNVPSKISLTEDELMEKVLKVKSSHALLNDTEQVDVKEDSNVPSYDTGKSLKELKETAIVLRQQLESLESQKNMMDVEYLQAHKQCEKAEADIKNVENILSSIGISVSDIPDTETVNLFEKLQKNIDTLHRKSEDVTSKNLALKAEIDKVRNKDGLSESQRNKCKKILINLKESAKAMKEEYEKKELLRDEMKQNYEKLRKGHKRSVYTKRILEIISNVDKQNMEIQKILEDTRQIQKEINTLEGQLDRCFSIADETLFRDAKKDDQAKKAYKLLALLHSECNTIVSLVNDMGTMSREIVDLEENIKTETAKRMEDTLGKIQLDISRMQQEC